jgi:hypothetical protein
VLLGAGLGGLGSGCWVEAVGCVVGVPRVGSPAVTHTLTLSRQAIMGTVRAWKTQVAREGGPRLCTSKQRQPAVGVQHQRGRSLEPQDHRPRRGRENNARPRPLQAWDLDARCRNPVSRHAWPVPTRSQFGTWTKRPGGVGCAGATVQLCNCKMER